MPNINKNPPKRKPVPVIPRAARGDLPLNRKSLASGKAKIVKKSGKRLTLKSKDQSTTWLFVPKRGSFVVKNNRKT
jgi:hypothetical protein